MRKLLLLGLLWGSASAQTAWTAGNSGTLVRFVGSGDRTMLQYAAPAQGGLEDTVLEFSTTTGSGTPSGSPTFCTRWVNVGTLSGSVVIQTYTGDGGNDLTQLQLNDVLSKRFTASAAAFAAPLCRLSRLTAGRVLYVPLNTPVAISLDLTLTLKANSAGRVVATLK